jgi:hypothetical protein
VHPRLFDVGFGRAHIRGGAEAGEAILVEIHLEGVDAGDQNVYAAVELEAVEEQRPRQVPGVGPG